MLGLELHVALNIFTQTPSLAEAAPQIQAEPVEGFVADEPRREAALLAHALGKEFLRTKEGLRSRALGVLGQHGRAGYLLR